MITRCRIGYSLPRVIIVKHGLQEGGAALVKRTNRFFILLICCVLLPGCSSSAPKATDISASLAGNRTDYEIVADYLCKLDYDYAFISSQDGQCFYGLEFHVIESDKVQASIKHLWRNGCEFICKDAENGNQTIWFQLWHRTRGSLDCGLACTMNGRGVPQAEFQTYCEEIASGWYYYYSDYEAYRVNSK